MMCKSLSRLLGGLAPGLFLLALADARRPRARPGKEARIVMLMTDDTGWNDFGAYTGGGAAPGHPTPNIDCIAKEGALFTSW